MEIDGGIKGCGLSLCAVPFYTSVPLYFKGAEWRDRVDKVHTESEI